MRVSGQRGKPRGGPGLHRRPKTKWRPAFLPASTVPGSVGPARRRNRLSQGGSGRGLAAPVGPSGSFAGPLLVRFRFLRVPILALRPVFGSLAGSFPFGLAASRSGSLSDFDEAEASSMSFRGSFRPGASGSAGPRRKVGSALACAAASRFFLPVARTFASFGFRPKTSAAFRGAVSGSTFPFPDGRSLPQEGHCTHFPSRGKR